jgi:transposase
MASDRSDDLFPETRNPKNTCVINERCVIRSQDGHRVVLVCGMPLAQYAVTDRMSEAHAMVSLVDQGWADQNDVARAFGYSERTVRRHQERWEHGGLAALGRADGYPRGRDRLEAWRRRLMRQLKAQGHSNCEIARRMGISEKAVRKTLRRLGWQPKPVVQDELPLNSPGAASPNPPPSSAAATSTPTRCPASNSDPNLSAFAASVPELSPASTFDTDPMDRRGDRLMARLGLLDDAPPLFGTSPNVPQAGVLLAIPALVRSGIFDCAQKIYGSLGPAFYGLRTTLLTLLLMALWRIKRPEGLKEHSPRGSGPGPGC